jgi:hypothetical protein
MSHVLFWETDAMEMDSAGKRFDSKNAIDRKKAENAAPCLMVLLPQNDFVDIGKKI